MKTTYSDEENLITFITITEDEGSFAEMLPNFPELLVDSLDLDVEIENIFPTSISINLVGEEEAILEACGVITQLLIKNQIYSFNFKFHTVQNCN